MKKIKYLIAVLAVFAAANLVSPQDASAQRWAVGTNAAELAWFGTLNIQGSAAIARHFTFDAKMRYNPWSWREAQGVDRQINQKQQAYKAGVRWWPWNIYSGWWFGLAGQWQEFNYGGLWGRNPEIRKITREGTAYGGVLSGGFTLMLDRHLNVEFGFAGWAGMEQFVTYSCPKCGRIEKLPDGSTIQKKPFILPDEFMINLVWIF